MADPTVRRVYLGGSIETAARPEAAFKTDSLLTVEGVDVLYGKAQALRGVSIHVHEGEFVSVVGLNGAGKTTLFNAISNLVPHAGTIRFGGQDLARMTPAAIARAGIVQVPETRDCSATSACWKTSTSAASPVEGRGRQGAGQALRAVPDPEGPRGRARARCPAASSRC